MTAVETTQVEMAFVRARLESQARHDRRRCTGISSDALAAYALGWSDPPAKGSYPSDPSDLAACFRTFAMAPMYLRLRMADVLAHFRAHVSARYPDAKANVHSWPINPLEPFDVDAAIERGEVA